MSQVPPSVSPATPRTPVDTVTFDTDTATGREHQRTFSDLGREAAGIVTDAAGTAKAKARDLSRQALEFAQANPYKALAIAAGIGFVAGLILKRR